MLSTENVTNATNEKKTIISATCSPAISTPNDAQCQHYAVGFPLLFHAGIYLTPAINLHMVLLLQAYNSVVSTKFHLAHIFSII